MKEAYIEHIKYQNFDFYRGQTYLIWTITEDWEVYELIKIQIKGFDTELQFEMQHPRRKKTIKFSEDAFCQLLDDGEVAKNTFWNRVKAKFHTL